MSARRILIFGDAFGVPQLLQRLASGVVGIVGAGIRPDSLAALGEMAAGHNLPLYVQPAYSSADYDRFREAIVAAAPDLMLVNSYAMVLRPDLLALASDGAFNVHWSLLPRHRGPNPLQWALIHGDTETGVTIHYVSDAIDSGDAVAQVRVAIQRSDTWITLRERIIAAADGLLTRSLPDIASGKVERRPQDSALATTNPRLTPESPRIDPVTMSDEQIFNLIRAQVAPLNGAYFRAGSSIERFDRYVPLEDIPSLRARLLRCAESALSSAITERQD
jgi:methionyl-tRNA formyltransferase